MRRTLGLVFAGVVFAASGNSICAHDIPNEQVDRSIQATVEPGRLMIDYEVSLAELTLAQDLRRLAGVLPGAERPVLFDRYGRETGPLNAKGFVVAVDKQPIDLKCRGFDLAVESHPRYTFHFEAALPSPGRLLIRDTNYSESRGTSRLAIRGRRGVVVRGDSLPDDITQIPVRPVWQLTDDEERRTREISVEIALRETARGERSAVSRGPSRGDHPHEAPGKAGRDNALSRLLDRGAGVSTLGLAFLAFGLGIVHTLQPGHGKSLVAAASLGGRGRTRDGILLAGLTTLTHLGSVAAIALLLWATRSTRYGEWNAVLTRAAGFAIAAVGLWRVGRHAAGHPEHSHQIEMVRGGRSLVGLGVAGGMVPCWDAILLVVLAEATDRLTLGLILLLTFSLGMAAVLIIVGVMASKVRAALAGSSDTKGVWSRRLGLSSGVILATIGLFVLYL